MDLQDNNDNENLSKETFSENNKSSINKYANKKVLLIAIVLLIGAPILGVLL